MKKIKENYFTIIVIALVVVINISAFLSYAKNVKSSLWEQTNSHIQNIIEEDEECINLKLEEQVNTISSLASFISSVNKYNDNPQLIEDVLNNQCEKSGYTILEIVDTDGKGNATGDDYAECSYFKNALKGKAVMDTEEEGDSVANIVFAVPVYNAEDEKEIISVVVAKMTAMRFTEGIEIESLNQNGKVFVVKKDGTLISKTDSLKDVSQISGLVPDKSSVDSLISGMRSRNSGVVVYETDDYTRYIGYSKLSFNKWYVVGIISSETVKASVSDMENDVIILGVELGVILLVMVVYLIYNIIKVKNKEKMNLERYFITAKYADTIMLDYSIAGNSMYVNEKWAKVFGYELPRSEVKENINKYIADEDYEMLVNSYKEMMEKNTEVQFNLKLLNSNEEPIECSVKLFPICEKKGKIIKIIGMIEINDK